MLLLGRWFHSHHFGFSFPIFSLFFLSISVLLSRTLIFLALHNSILSLILNSS